MVAFAWWLHIYLSSPLRHPGAVVHRRHMTQFRASEAQQQEMIKMSRFGGGIGAPGREERLTGAAEMYVRLGNVRRYCEIMVDLGRSVDG